MNKAVFIVPAAVIGLVVIGLVLFLLVKPNPGAAFGGLPEGPRLVDLPEQRMLVIEVKGDPNRSLPAAFETLFRTYYSLPQTPKAGPPPAPRLRCTVPGDLDAAAPLGGEAFTATVGLPLPASVEALPAGPVVGPRTAIAVWSYGETAEILHRGAYDKEVPTIKRLLAFIAEQGRAVAGIHEEEYLSGPGTPGATSETYLTVIRYPVKK